MRYLLITFMRQPGGQINEQVSVSKRVRTSDNSTCNVIMDFAEKKVIKCVIEGKLHDTTFERMAEYYRKIYPTLISQLEKEAPITAKQKTK
jgi:hypothetical protein